MPSSAPPTDFLRYSPDLETIAPDEEGTIASIVEAMKTGERFGRETYGRSLRSSHSKAHALLKGELAVTRDLPPELRQGIFAVERSYPVLARLSHAPGELLDDRRVSTPRGLALKIFGGPRTQDFVLDTGKAFNVPNAKAFLVAITATQNAAPRMPEAAKAFVSRSSRGLNAVLHAVGLHSKNLDFYGHPNAQPLAEAYYSQVPFRYGEYVAKLAVTPNNLALSRLGSEPYVPTDENGHRTTAQAFFREHEAEYAVSIQLCTDVARMPIEDASAEWPEDVSPYRLVGRLRFPAQDAYARARADFVEGSMAFSPAHTLPEHRPLGSIARARLVAYEVMSTRRRQANGEPLREPTWIGEIPD